MGDAVDRISENFGGVADHAVQYELGVVYDVLRHFVSKTQRRELWRIWKPVLERHPLSNGTPFANVVMFSSAVTRQCGLDSKKKLTLRRTLFQRLMQCKAAKTQPRAKATGSAPAYDVYRVRYHASGMDGFENAAIRKIDDSHIELVSKRGLVVGNTVNVLLRPERDGEQSCLHAVGRVTDVTPLDAGRGYRYEVAIDTLTLKAVEDRG